MPDRQFTSTSQHITLTRGPDRRRSTRAVVPPYITIEGLVLIDRRSHLDRRSAWIRDFSIDFAHWSKS